MQCKDFECLIIDSSEKNLPKQELISLQQHLKQCARCARFQDDLEKIRADIKTQLSPALSPELWERTKTKCLKLIDTGNKTTEIQATKLSVDPIPKIIWGALFSLILLTVLVMIPALKDFRWDEALSFSSATILTLILQNAAMLVFAPILLRKRRWRKPGFRKMTLI